MRVEELGSGRSQAGHAMAKGTSKRRKTFQLSKEVKKLARERIGAVPAGRTIQPATASGKKPKHPKKAQEQWLEG